MNNKDFFWTDVQQASARIGRTVVMYGADPVFVAGVGPHQDEIPRAQVLLCSEPDGKYVRKMLNSPKFHRFRRLPKLGWFNHSNPQVGAIFHSRININAQTHGLNHNNVRATAFHRRTGDNSSLSHSDYSFQSTMFDKGWVDANADKFPSLKKILAVIEEDSSVAFCPLFCVYRDRDGLRWLYRNLDKVGIFTGIDTLNLFTKYGYLAEEIMSEPSFTIDNIREF